MIFCNYNSYNNNFNPQNFNNKFSINNNNNYYNNFYQSQMNQNQFKIIQKQKKEHPLFNNIDFNQFPVNNKVNNYNANLK